jgi:ribonuclease HI
MLLRRCKWQLFGLYGRKTSRYLAFSRLVPKDQYMAYADGACRGNPGLAGCGAILYGPNGSEIASRMEFLGDKMTNNEAEYHGLLVALQLAKEFEIIQQHLMICMDSQLVIKQMQGLYRVKAPHLKVLHQEAKELAFNLPNIQFQYIPREENTKADQLANTAIDQRKY